MPPQCCGLVAVPQGLVVALAVPVEPEDADRRQLLPRGLPERPVGLGAGHEDQLPEVAVLEDALLVLRPELRPRENELLVLEVLEAHAGQDGREPLAHRTGLQLRLIVPLDADHPFHAGLPPNVLLLLDHVARAVHVEHTVLSFHTNLCRVARHKSDSARSEDAGVYLTPRTNDAAVADFGGNHSGRGYFQIIALSLLARNRVYSFVVASSAD